MLGEEALQRMHKLALQCAGPIIELGPYIGGSTIAMASAPRAGVVTVELGGANPHHDTIPSEDIVSDLNANLARHGLAGRVRVVVGHFQAASTIEQVRMALGGRQADMLFVDIHPGTEIALQLYAQFLSSEAFVVVDDYRSEIAATKAVAVKCFLDRATVLRVLEFSAVLGWGTWFGRLRGADCAMKLREIPASIPCVRESGYCWHMFLGRRDESDDRCDNASALVLLENDRPLGPAHCLHQEIRDYGCGRYSHWNGHLWFSTSDNTDPNKNGRRYAMEFLGRRQYLDAAESLHD